MANRERARAVEGVFIGKVRMRGVSQLAKFQRSRLVWDSAGIFWSRLFYAFLAGSCSLFFFLRSSSLGERPPFSWWMTSSIQAAGSGLRLVSCLWGHRDVVLLFLILFFLNRRNNNNQNTVEMFESTIHQFQCNLPALPYYLLWTLFKVNTCNSVQCTPYIV